MLVSYTFLIEGIKNIAISPDKPAVDAANILFL